MNADASSPETDAAWAASHGRSAQRILADIAKAEGRSAKGRSIELIGKRLLSLPPALLIEGGWKILNLSENPGLDPSLLSELERLDIVVLSGCELPAFDLLPPSGLKRLALDRNGLSHWPAGLAGVGDDLAYLNIAKNLLTRIPDDVAELRVLDTLHASNNNITVVSPAIGQLGSLTRLYLLGNRELSTLPVEILDLPQACDVSLAITSLPASFQKARTIGDLRKVWGDLDPS